MTRARRLRVSKPGVKAMKIGQGIGRGAHLAKASFGSYGKRRSRRY